MTVHANGKRCPLCPPLQAKPAAKPVSVTVTDSMLEAWYKTGNDMILDQLGYLTGYEYNRERLRRWMEAIK